jgi:hypothetical protein
MSVWCRPVRAAPAGNPRAATAAAPRTEMTRADPQADFESRPANPRFRIVGYAFGRASPDGQPELPCDLAQGLGGHLASLEAGQPFRRSTGQAWPRRRRCRTRQARNGRASERSHDRTSAGQHRRAAHSTRARQGARALRSPGRRPPHSGGYGSGSRVGSGRVLCPGWSSFDAAGATAPQTQRLILSPTFLQ